MFHANCRSKKRQALTTCTKFSPAPAHGHRRAISVVAMAESQVRNYPYAPVDVRLLNVASCFSL
jgi:hypothetical protein